MQISVSQPIGNQEHPQHSRVQKFVWMDPGLIISKFLAKAHQRPISSYEKIIMRY